MTTRTLELLKDGLPLVENPSMLKVTTIKRKFVDQMPRMAYATFYAAITKDSLTDGHIDIIGRVGTEKLVLVQDGHYYRLGVEHFCEWRMHRYIDEMNSDCAIKQAKDDFMAIPQLFEE